LNCPGAAPIGHIRFDYLTMLHQTFPSSMISVFRRFLVVTIFVLALAQTTDPASYPGYADLELCAKSAISGCTACDYNGVRSVLKCSNWICVCDNYASAVKIVSSAVVSLCTDDLVQVTSATSILNAFCSRLLATLSTPILTTTTGPTISSTGKRPAQK
jgi:hypothetical protein